MAKAVSSTETSRRGNRAAQGRWHLLDDKLIECSSALCSFHAVLDPIFGINAGRRVHALGGETHDIDDLGLVLLLIEPIGAVSRLRDALVSVADGELDRT